MCVHIYVRMDVYTLKNHNIHNHHTKIYQIILMLCRWLLSKQNIKINMHVVRCGRHFVKRGGVRQINNGARLDCRGWLRQTTLKGGLKGCVTIPLCAPSLDANHSFLHDFLLQEVTRTLGLLSHLCLRSLRV